MVFRALASLVATALLLVGAPLSPSAAAMPAQAARHAPLAVGAMPQPRPEPRPDPDSGSRSGSRSDSGSEDSDRDRTLLAERDSGAVAVALTSWSTDHRPMVRDHPDAYTPVLPWIADLGRPWARVAPPGSEDMPDLNGAFALPFGRAPPFTEHM
ncbi:hypothetical protein [Streptomonospora sediminis]